MNSPLEFREIELTELQVGQVLVKVLVSGLCGSQLQEIEGNKGNGKFLPHLMGHEGVGIVEDIGPGVTKVKVGQKVVMHWRVGEGIDAPFPNYILDGKRISSGKVTTLSEKSIVSENRLTAIPNEVPNEFAALLGCGLTTALGIVSNEAQIRFGESLLVVGCGGVGLNIIQAAKLANAYPIIGLDIRESKENLVKTIGADFFFSGQIEEGLMPIIEKTWNKAVDVIIDTTGNPDIIQKLPALLSNAGRLILVGQPKPGQSIEIPNALNLFGTSGKTIKTTQGGMTNPTMDIPRYIHLNKANLITAENVVTHKFKLEEINKAIEVLKSGIAGRIMVEINHE